jgi:hypothetical protein
MTTEGPEMSKLSFDLYKYDVAMAELVGKIRNGLLEHDPLLGQIRVQNVSHGGSTRQVTGPQTVETQMVKTSATFQMDKSAFVSTDVKQFAEAVHGMIEDFHSQQKKKMFELISQTTDAVGNTIDAAGKNFWDAYLEMIEKTQMSFDERGDHNYQIIINPKTAEKVRQNPPTEEQQKRIQEAIERKRKEYYERKPSRRLS